MYFDKVVKTGGFNYTFFFSPLFALKHPPKKKKTKKQHDCYFLSLLLQTIIFFHFGISQMSNYYQVFSITELYKCI